jgi:peptidoglycan hydrolase CwlO-like protein
VTLRQPHVVHRATDFSGDKMKRSTVVALVLSLLLVTASAFAQSSTSSELKELKDAIAAQQQQIQQLQQQVQSRDAAIQQLQQQVGSAQAAAQAAQATADGALPKAEALDKQYFDPLQHDVTDLSSMVRDGSRVFQC